eukprot:m.138804 g.138804  ORF g.138804 m.138804 type:complete len:277 (+) comp30016_c0_seq1:199-1029(+)
MSFTVSFVSKVSILPLRFRQSYKSRSSLVTMLRSRPAIRNKTVASSNTAGRPTAPLIPKKQHVVYPNSIEWIATRVVRELPPDVHQKLTIVSIGAGSGQNDMALAHCLTNAHGCKVQSYVLVDPVEHPAADTFYPQIMAEKVIKSKTTADTFVENLSGYFSVTVLFNSLMHIGDDDPNAIHRFMQGSPFGRHCSPLTFITGNPNAATVYGSDGFMAMVGTMPAVVESDTISFESEVVHEEFVHVDSNRENREIISSDSNIACFLLHRKDVIKQQAA